MTSAINTGGINVNYPVPGVNNSSQGFRDNFAAIKTNIDTGANEITDIQNKGIFKSALTGGVLDNNMANTLISNASTRGFRASTYNIGNDISGAVIINVSLGDVQYGTITGNTQFQFTGWAPVGTQSNLQLQLAVANTEAVISFPQEIKINGASGALTLENYSNVGNIVTVTIPHGVTAIDYRLSTLDCGNNITIEPFNRPRTSTQLQLRTPTPIGFQGDVPGTFSMDQSTGIAFALCTAVDGTYNVVTCDSTSGFYLDMPVVFTGSTFGGILAGATYYIRNIISSTQFTLSTTPGTVSGPGQLVNLSTGTGVMSMQPVSYLYASTGDYDGVITTKYAISANVVTASVTATNTSANTNSIAVSSVSGFVEGYPVGFSGTATTGYITNTNLTGNITVNTTANMVVGGRFLVESNAFGGLSATFYYIQNVDSINSNIKLAADYYNAVANTNTLTFSTSAGNAPASWNNLMGNLIIQDYYVKEIEPSATSGNFIIGRTYTIESVGTTDFMALGSPNNFVGTTFTATGSGIIDAGSFIFGQNYIITYVGTTDWTAIGAASNTAGISFTASGVGSGNGQAAYGNGVATAINQFTVSTTPGGAEYSLVSENGSMTVTAINDYTITLNSTTGLANNDPIVFSGNTFGGIFANTIYYIANVTNGTNISVSSTLYNGIAGQKLPLSNGNGNMRMDSYTGTSIWKSVPLKPIGSTDDGSALSGDLVVYGNATVYGNTTLGNVSANISNANTFNGTFAGNVNAYDLTVSNLANVTTSQLKITGGTSGQYLQTDGLGNISWVNGTVSGTTTAAGGANTQVQFNDAGTINGDNQFTWNKNTNTLTLGNALSVTGNTTSGNLSVTANANVGNLGTTGLIVATGNINAGNFTTSGNVIAPNIVNGTTNIRLTASGNININVAGTSNVVRFTSSGAIITGTVSSTGNANVGNIGATAGVFAGSLTGVTTITANGNITTSNSVVSGQYIVSGVTTGISANGTIQADATQLSDGFNVVSTVGSGANNSVKLPSAAAGIRVMVRNNTANNLYVFPFSGDNINYLALNLAFTQGPNTTNEFFCVDTQTWYSIND